MENAVRKTAVKAVRRIMHVHGHVIDEVAAHLAVAIVDELDAVLEIKGKPPADPRCKRCGGKQIWTGTPPSWRCPMCPQADPRPADVVARHQEMLRKG